MTKAIDISMFDGHEVRIDQHGEVILALENPGRLFPGYDINTYGSIVIVSKVSFLITSVIFMTAGTMSTSDIRIMVSRQRLTEFPRSPACGRWCRAP